MDILWAFDSVETQQGHLSDVYSREETSSRNPKYKPSPRPTAKSHQPREVCEGIRWRDFPAKGCGGTELLWRIAPRLSFAVLPGAPHFVCIRNKLQVCFRRGCCLLTLAFCESARCHGDHRLDSSSEQGLVKWAKGIRRSTHFGAGRVPVRSAASLLG